MKRPQEVRTPSNSDPDRVGSTQGEPQCARCGGQLGQCGGGYFASFAGTVFVVVGVAGCAMGPLLEHQVLFAPGVAAIILGAALLRRRLWWQCTSCGIRFWRRLPSRGFAKGKMTDSEDLGEKD